MPWGFRKSLKMGPFRMTFSKSGISTSVGVKGARMTVGPRGTYVTVGAGGIYYRQRLAASLAPAGQQPQVNQPQHQEPSSMLGAITVETIDLTSLRSTSADEVAREINDRWTKFEWSKVTLWPTIIVGIIGFSNPFLFILAALLGALTWYLKVIEKREKTVHLTYQLDPVGQAAYDNVLSFWDRLSTSQKLWSIVTSKKTTDYKRNAGASSLIERKPVSLLKGTPRFLETNVLVYSLSTGPYRLYFLPDRLIVQSANAVSAIPYHRLTVQDGQTRFVEEAGAPRDTKVVGQTWRFVNKSGGPDRRFNNNRQLPVCLYGVVELESLPGLRLELQCSNPTLSISARESFSRIGALSTATAIG